MPFAGFANFDACILAQQKKGHGIDAARRICGEIKKRSESMSTPYNIHFTELVRTESVQRVDREAGIIYGVKILGRESRNGRIYSEKAMQQAASFYEGIEVNLDHSESERSFTERFGQIRESKFDGKGAVNGNLHYLKSHPYAEAFVEAVERFPNSFGLSHDAKGKGYKENGKEVVESIEHVNSVDVVGRPATNKGLFESERKMPDTKTISEIVESSKDNKTDMAEGLRRCLKESGGDRIGKQSVDVTDVKPEHQIRLAFQEAAAGAAGSDGLIKALFNLKENQSAVSSSKDQPADSSDDTKALREEIAALRAERDQDKKENNARSLLESAGVEATAPRISAVVRCESEEERKALIEDLPKQGGRHNAPQRPERSPSKFFTESNDSDEGKSYRELKESRTILSGAKNKK